MLEFNSALYKLVGERIKQLRCEHGLSQEGLSQKVSTDGNSSITLSRTSISNIEVGRHQPPLHVLSQLSKALRTEVHFLLPTYNEVLDYLDSEILNSDSISNNKDIIELLQQKNLTSHTEKKIESIIKSL